MPSTSFRFGPNSEHEVQIKCGYFGHEQYFVDNELVHSRWSLRMNGVTTFTSHGHNIRVTIVVSTKGIRGEASVDGELISTELFSDLNAKLFHRDFSPSRPAKFAVWLGMVAVFLAAFKYFD